MQKSRDRHGRDKPRIPRDHSRSLTDLPIAEAGYQVGQDRFPDFSPRHLRDESTPYLNSWRNNLTALSQSHNLYFIAYEDEIHVFRPEFPAYTLSSKPSCILELPSTGSDLPGHTQDSKPHSVNNIIVDNLGVDEILLCVCDDGDVLAYWTARIEESIAHHEAATLAVCRKHRLSSHIVPKTHAEFNKHCVTYQAEYERKFPQEALENTRVEKELSAVSFGSIKPSFHSNVGDSAWGIAVHSYRRMVAVSSNNHSITIFYFARDETAQDEASKLAQEIVYSKLSTTLDESNDDGFWDLSGSRVDLDMNFITKHLNYFTSYSTHGTNIPSIGFDNASEAPLLISTDISGLTIVWDLSMKDYVRALVPKSGIGFSFGGYDRISGGWGVMFIDRRAFVPATDLATAMGTCRTYTWQDVFIADISDSRTQKQKNAPLRIDERNLLTTASVLSSQVNSIDNDPDSSSDAIYSDTNEDDLSLPHLLPRISIHGLLALNENNHIPHTELDTNTLKASPLKYMFTSDIHTPSTAYPTRYKIPTTTPIVLLNPRKITLFQSPDLTTRTIYNPLIFLDDPLHQPCATQLGRLLHECDRLNLYHVIPAIGVLLVGSPKGRVAVLTLWSLKNPFYNSVRDAVEEPARVSADWNQRRGKEVEDDVCTMRLEHLLPTPEQDEKGVRPLQPLVGLAASPVPGSGICGSFNGDGGARNSEARTTHAADHAGSQATGGGGVGTKAAIVAAGAKRWRIMLMYRDHTLLTYEICRRANGAVGIGF